MPTDPEKPADTQPDGAGPAPIIPAIEDGAEPAKAIEEKGEPFDDNFA